MYEEDEEEYNNDDYDYSVHIRQTMLPSEALLDIKIDCQCVVSKLVAKFKWNQFVSDSAMAESPFLTTTENEVEWLIHCQTCTYSHGC